MVSRDEPLVVDDGLEVRALAGSRDAAAALELLAAAEEADGAPPVDEAERVRLEAARDGGAATAGPSGWRGVLARRGGRPVGYGGVVAGPDGAHGDVAAAPDARAGAVTGVLLEALGVVARRRGAPRLAVWLRHAGEPQVAAAADAGHRVARRLAVLGRSVDALPDRAVPAGMTLRAYRPGADDEAVAGVLAGAYAGTEEAGWDVERLARRRRFDWFRAEDLLLLEGPEGLAGLHWTKRRGGGVGEVYNLAVAPAAQGRGLGAVLLVAGLRHLAAVGCREVVLWVDRANDAAVGLYREHGFTTRWEDLQVARSLAG